MNDGPESCNSYNMLKLSEGLFRSDPEAKYMDYYERTLFNHILSTQHPEHDGYVYYTPARPRHYRVYSAPNQAMWCCVGTGMENHVKYNELIFTHVNDDLYVNLFIASELNWKNNGVKIRQETSFPFEEQTKLTITEVSSEFNLMLRYPAWVSDGDLNVTVNGEDFSYSAFPSSYVSIIRKWKQGDVIQVLLPMHNTVEHLPNVPGYRAFMHGPILLGAKTGTEDLKGLVADDSPGGDYASGAYLPLDEAPILIEDDLKNIAARLEPIANKPLNFRLNVEMVDPIELTLEPFYQIHDARNMMYWLALTSDGYRGYLDALENIEEERLAVEQRTIDCVAVGEQQPEMYHDLQVENSTTDNNHHEYYREARNERYLSYDLATQ